MLLYLITPEEIPLFCKCWKGIDRGQQFDIPLSLLDNRKTIQASRLLKLIPTFSAQPSSLIFNPILTVYPNYAQEAQPFDNSPRNFSPKT